MKKKFSIYHFLVALMLSTLLLPAFAGASEVNGGSNGSDSPKGSLTIHKFEQEPGSEKGDGDGSKLDSDPTGERLEGVEFTLTQTHKYDPDTDKWTEVTGDPKTYKETTGSDGKIVIKNIDLGRYSVKETNGPEHVVLNDEEYFVDIPMTSADGTELNWDVHVYPKNETIRGSVEIIKTDGENDEPLQGVKFHLYDGVNDLLHENIVTDANGKYVVDGLPFGNYYLVEVETIDGYLKKHDRRDFSISEQGETVEVHLENFKEPDVEKEISEGAVNRGETVTYTITVDLPADIKDYESFVITDVLHENLQYVDSSESSPSAFTFNQDGQTLTWKLDPNIDIKPGSAVITFDAVVSEDAKANESIDNEAEIEYDNGYDFGGKKTPGVPVLPTAGTIVVIKKDGDTQERLDGAKFELRQGDNVVAKGTTDSTGTIDFGEVDYGTYELVETKAPNGYNKLNNPIEVVVNESESNHEITIDNYKKSGDWQLPKTGGIGTMLFTFIGLSLMGGASFMFMRRRNGEEA